MVSMLASSAVDRVKPKTIKLERKKSKDRLARNQDNVRVDRHVYPWTVVSVN